MHEVREAREQSLGAQALLPCPPYGWRGNYQRGALPDQSPEAVNARLNPLGTVVATDPSTVG